MNPLTTLRLALAAMLEHPLRTLLTSLGIIIGVGAVFVMLAIGEGSRRQLLEQMNSVSTRTVSVYEDWGRRAGRASEARPRKPFSEADLTDFRAMTGVQASTGQVSRSMPVVSETADWVSSVRGVATQWLEANDVALVRGDPINEVDLDQRATVAVIGQTVANTLYRGEDPLGQRIRINNIPFTIKGIAGKSESQSWGGQDPDDFVLIPVTTARIRLMGGNPYVQNYFDSLTVVANPTTDVARMQNEMEAILQRNRGLAAGESPDYRMFNFAANVSAQAKSSEALSLLLAAMGTVSLVVGGVGVMNIMLVSVTERTREIGLRMALGARQSDVMGQFLTEALLLCLFGGLMGLGLGWLPSLMPVWPEEMTLVYTWQTGLLAFGSAMAIGVIFGFLPARRAAALNPIEALRTE
jgi:putative ABC transport system permease protein